MDYSIPYKPKSDGQITIISNDTKIMLDKKFRINPDKNYKQILDASNNLYNTLSQDTNITTALTTTINQDDIINNTLTILDINNNPITYQNALPVTFNKDHKATIYFKISNIQIDTPIAIFSYSGTTNLGISRIRTPTVPASLKGYYQIDAINTDLESKRITINLTLFLQANYRSLQLYIISSHDI